MSDTKTGVGAIVWSEPAPSVLKKLLVADASWSPWTGGAYAMQGIQNAMTATPSPRPATYEDIARALNLSEAALRGFLAHPHLQEMAARPALTEEDAKADLAGEPRPSFRERQAESKLCACGRYHLGPDCPPGRNQ